MSCPRLLSAAAAVGALAITTAAVVALGCQADLNARTEPLDTTEPPSTISGRYTGLYRIGAAGDSRPLELVAEDCGGVITGTLQGPDGADVPITGGAQEGAISASFASTDFSGSITGSAATSTVLEGTWSSFDGQGGSWTALYDPSSGDEFPSCGGAEPDATGGED